MLVHKSIFSSAYVALFVMYCFLSPSKQVHDLIEAHQPQDPHGPEVHDYLVVAERPGQKRDSSHIEPGSTQSENYSRLPASRGNYWKDRMSHSMNFAPQLTASMQRQRVHSRGSVLSAQYRNKETRRWNKTLPNPISDLTGPKEFMEVQAKQTFDRLSIDDATTPTSAEDFVGADGKLKMTICDHPNGFLRRQKKLCRRYLHLMESVVRGYFMGLKECEYRFSAHRWNCQGHNLTLQTPSKFKRRLRYRQSPNSPSNPVRIRTYLDKLLSKGTRESAYVMAVTSAGVSHAVTKACSSGLHENCGCDRTIYDHPREPNFEWSGCSDNIHFGAAFSRQFLDVRERSRIRRRPKLAMTNLHNNHVGRQAVINKMEVQCKCHGVSGSCEMRTCWRSLPKFRDLGAHLQELFRKAILVDYIDQQLVRVPDDEVEANGNANPGPLYRRSLPQSSQLTSHQPSDRLPAPSESDLIYITRSPTFCHHDPGYGSLGTYGRQCSEDPKEANSCDYLCCGRGFKRETFVQEERCNCKFQWCCKVLCQTCRKTVVVSTCN